MTQMGGLTVRSPAKTFNKSGLLSGLTIFLFLNKF
jgi:hypothetical protein